MQLDTPWGIGRTMSKLHSEGPGKTFRGFNERSDTDISRMFLSSQNMDIIQTTLRAQVFEITNEVIDNQSETHLLSLMLDVFEMNESLDYRSVTEEVTRLNAIVVTVATRQVLSGLVSFFRYLDQIGDPNRASNFSLVPLSTNLTQRKMPLRSPVDTMFYSA